MATVVVKLGSSIVADPRGEVRTEVIDPLCAEVAARHHAGDSVVMVTSGAIARGMRIMNLPARPAAMDELQAASAVGQGPLYQVYEGLLAQRDVPSAQVLLTFFDMSARSHYVNARHTLSRLLEWRVVPVINENDTTTTDEISFGDNDFLAAQVAILLGAERLVLLTDTDGLYTADPAVDPAAEPVTDVTSFEQLESLDIGFSASPLGSGGMRSKVVAAEMATAAGIPATIARGTDAAQVRAALAGQPAGTRFHPSGARVSSFKLWLKYAKPVQGVISVDAGRRPRADRARHQPAAGGHHRRGGPLRRRRRRRDPGGRGRQRADRQGHRELQLVRAGAGPGHEVREGARDVRAPGRGGRAPRLLRPGIALRSQ